MKKITKIIISGILFFTIQNAAFAGHEEITEKSVSEEIGYLKSVIADLEERVGRLEKHPKPKIESAHNEEKIDPQTGWKHRKSWLQIKEGMSEAEVESILGHPARVDDMGKGFKKFFYRGHVTSGAISGSIEIYENNVYKIHVPVFHQ
ncbi:MAG: hypothetical protein WCL34_12510 [Methylococcaceae bacterium]